MYWKNIKFSRKIRIQHGLEKQDHKKKKKKYAHSGYFN